ncbi:hypothetical protein AAC387_Pa03g1485 [Persea americana]
MEDDVGAFARSSIGGSGRKYLESRERRVRGKEGAGAATSGRGKEKEAANTWRGKERAGSGGERENGRRGKCLGKKGERMVWVNEMTMSFGTLEGKVIQNPHTNTKLGIFVYF